MTDQGSAMLQLAALHCKAGRSAGQQARIDAPFGDLAHCGSGNLLRAETGRLLCLCSATQHHSACKASNGLGFMLLAHMQRAVMQLRYAILRHYMARLVQQHLAAIKARLWRPEGRLVQRRRARLQRDAAEERVIACACCLQS